MAFERYPNTVTINYITGVNTLDSVGVFTPGTMATLSITGRIDDNAGNANSYVIGANGDRMEYKKTFYCRRFANCDNITEGSELHFAGQAFKIISNHKKQKHVEMRLI